MAVEKSAIGLPDRDLDITRCWHRRKLFCGRTDVRTDGRTLRPALLGRVDLKIAHQRNR